MTATTIVSKFSQRYEKASVDDRKSSGKIQTSYGLLYGSISLILWSMRIGFKNSGVESGLLFYWQRVGS